MATPVDKLNLLFGEEDWRVYYEQYTKSPIFGNSMNRVIEDSLIAPEPEATRLRIENLQGLLSGRSNEFIVNVVTLFEEIYYGSGINGTSPIPDIERRSQIENGQQSQNMNIVGQFKMSDSSGNFIDYNRGDVVYYEGKTYIASRNVSGWVPESKHPENGWQPIDLPDETIDGSEF